MQVRMGLPGWAEPLTVDFTNAMVLRHTRLPGLPQSVEFCVGHYDPGIHRYGCVAVSREIVRVEKEDGGQ